ncbi:MAG: YHS domain-containing protein [Phycisphaerae bacterium]|nr:YHS domain-containing protein [Tepidisphaeraceae bacterium]
MTRTALFAAVASALVGAATLAFAADAPKPKGPTTKPSATKPVDPKPVNKFCAVEGGDHDVDPKVTVVYQGKTIGFCCRDCVDEFNKNPEKYAKGIK